MHLDDQYKAEEAVKALSPNLQVKFVKFLKINTKSIFKAIFKSYVFQRDDKSSAIPIRVIQPIRVILAIEDLLRMMMI